MERSRLLECLSTVSAPPAAPLRWLWGRGDADLSIDGSAEAVREVRHLLVAATQ